METMSFNSFYFYTTGGSLSKPHQNQGAIIPHKDTRP
jgi:hypothetical protein